MRPAPGWTGSLHWRYRGSGALIEDNSIRARPASTLNLRVMRQLTPQVALTLDVFRPPLAHRTIASKGAHGLCSGRGLLGAQFILGGRRHELSELQFQLIDQPLRALTARAVLLALKLAKQQLQMCV